MYLDDISAEFISTHKDYRTPNLRPYAFNDFDTFIQRSKKSYENPRASDNLSKLDQQLKETTQIMSKNLEDLLYRGDSLDKMGQMSSDLRESSKKYKRAAVRINWELLLKQVNNNQAFVATRHTLIANSTDHLPALDLLSSSSCSGVSGDDQDAADLLDWQLSTTIEGAIGSTSRISSGLLHYSFLRAQAQIQQPSGNSERALRLPGLS